MMKRAARASYLPVAALIVVLALAAGCRSKATPVPPTQVPVQAPTTAPTQAPAAEPTTAPAAPVAAPTTAVENSPLPTPALQASPLTSPLGTPSTSGSFTDPFAYCTAAGTIDKPDARYTGPKTPQAVIDGLQKALGLTGTPAPPIVNNSFWRCMNGKVYACTVGANLPCEEKANTSKTPSEEIAGFCKEQPDAEVVPAVVTGHNGIYEWRCSKGTPQIVKQVANADAQGYVADVWYEVGP